MVRLKVSLKTAGKIKRDIHFNSSMVRLKAGCIASYISPITQFQFQYGAIEGSESRADAGCHINFNSSMVRLKVRIRWLWCYPYPNFNSSMVRLKGEKKYKPACHFHVDFNSSMVRLKELIASPKPAKNAYFNSSMVRLKVKSGLFCCKACEISIPVWCD